MTDTQLSLDTRAARTLATTTKTVPQMQDVSARWLLRMLPWVDVSGGTYRVNRRLAYAVGGGQVSFAHAGDDVRIIPPSLGEIPHLAGFDDEAVLEALADGFTRQEVDAGATIVEAGQAADRLVVVVHGKVDRIGPGKYEERRLLAVEADGDFFGEEALGDAGSSTWAYTAVAATQCTLLSLPLQQFRTLVDQSEALQAHLEEHRARAARPQNKRGEAKIAIAAGHHGEPAVAGTFADYEAAPREYHLSVAQTILRVHTRVADLFNDPMDQVEQQLRLTVEALRERQEDELVNNPDFGLLHNVDRSQRLSTRTGPPTPDDMDDLLCRRRSTRLFLAHPRAIAAFGWECSARGIYPENAEVHGSRVPAWRTVPILPCTKLPISDTGTSTILALRTGEDEQGVVGLRPTALPDEHEPGLNVRFMGIDERAIARYLVSAYHSVAVLVPSALGALENVEISTRRSP